MGKQILLLLLLVISLGKTSACIDSVWTKIEPVQCFGLRNGEVKIKKVFGGTAPYFYSIDGQSFSTNPNFDHLFAGVYQLLVRDASGCIQTFELLVPEPPEFQVKLFSSDSVATIGKPLLLQAVISPETSLIKQFEWRPPQLFSIQDTLRQLVSISQATDFAVELTNQDGCAHRAHLKMEVEQANIYIPNALKPGSAEDAFFTVYGGEEVAQIAQLMIFSRSGAKIFDRHNFPPNDPLKGWNGKWDGQKVQPGVYVWIANVELLDGAIRHLEGTVTVME